ESRRKKHRRFSFRGFHTQRIRSASRDQSADRGVNMNRRRFLKTSGALACGFTGTTSFTALQAASVPEQGPNILGPREGFSPQIGTLVSMLNWMRTSILQPVQGLTVTQ